MNITALQNIVREHKSEVFKTKQQSQILQCDMLITNINDLVNLVDKKKVVLIESLWPVKMSILEPLAAPYFKIIDTKTIEIIPKCSFHVNNNILINGSQYNIQKIWLNNLKMEKGFAELTYQIVVDNIVNINNSIIWIMKHLD